MKKTFGLFIIIFIVLNSFVFINNGDKTKVNLASDYQIVRQTSKGHIALAEPTVSQFIAMDPKRVKVILERVYLDGEISEEILEETILSMEDFWAEYAEWNLVDQNEAQVVFQQKIDDISPLLKINGYFGISDEGILNIYEGKPSEEKVIQSFFQINMKKLKSHQQQQLENGIPVLSRDRYEQVLKMYKKYAKHEM